MCDIINVISEKKINASGIKKKSNLKSDLINWYSMIKNYNFQIHIEI